MLLAMNLRIRQAEVAEHAQLTDIALAAKRHWGYPEEWIALWRDDLTYTPASFTWQHVVCAEVCDASEPARIAGVCGLSIDGSEAEIQGLWVLPAYMGRGIGRALMAHVMDEARRRGASHLCIAADPNAAAFYEKLGARRTGNELSRPPGRSLPCYQIDLLPGGAPPA